MQGVCRPRVPQLSELFTPELREERVAASICSRRSMEKGAAHETPWPLLVKGREQAKSLLVPIIPAPPVSPGAQVKGSGTPVTEWPLPPFPRAKLWWGPRRDVGEKLWRGGSGRGRGASHQDWGKGPLGEVPKIRTPAVRAPSPGLAATRRPSPLPPGLKSSRVYHAHCPRERRPLPDSEGADLPEPLCSGWWRHWGGGETHPSECPQSPRGRPDPPPRYLASRVLAGGCCTKRRWSRETPNR